MRNISYKYMRFVAFSFFFVMLLVVACRPSPEIQDRPTDTAGQGTPVTAALSEALTFYASFDEQYAADYARGDATLYTAANWKTFEDATPVEADHAIVRRIAEGGRYGGALEFQTDWDPIVFFKGEDNIAYTENGWQGSFSFWLRVVPDEDLEEGYSDPFIVTDKSWDNASLYVDFTEDDRPRRFRFAVFSDYSFWNPSSTPWEEVAVADRPMIDVESAPFAAGDWTHVVLTFAGINSDAPATLIGYIDGLEAGRMETRVIRINWLTDRVLMALGRHYTGAFDELTVFDRVLTPDEVQFLYSEPITAWR